MVSVISLSAIINQLLPEPHAGLLSGILFGTKAALTKEFSNALIRSGTIHIIALSGQNISIIESLVASSLLHVVSKRITSLLTICIIIGFVWFVGPSASIIRAAIMGSFALLAVVFGRQQWSIFFFVLTCAIMLIVKPTWITDLSFQLSAAATLGIILFNAKKAGAWSFILDDLRVTLSAQVFTIPLIFFAFHRISLIAPLTNILIGWIIPPLTFVGFITVVLGWVFLPLGYVGAWVSWVMLEYVIGVVRFMSNIPFASVGF